MMSIIETQTEIFKTINKNMEEELIKVGIVIIGMKLFMMKKEERDRRWAKEDEELEQEHSLKRNSAIWWEK